MNIRPHGFLERTAFNSAHQSWNVGIYERPARFKRLNYTESNSWNLTGPQHSPDAKGS